MKDKKTFFQKKDIWILLLLLLAAAGIFLWYASKPVGAKAVVTFADGRKSEEIPLSTDAEYVFEGDNDIVVTLIVENGSVYFYDSQCPDHICEGVGKISTEGQSAVCMPAGVAVNIYK